MGRKLTNREKDEKELKHIIQKIKTMERWHGVDFVRRACVRYSIQRNSENRLQKEISKRESELNQLKEKAK